VTDVMTQIMSMNFATWPHPGHWTYGCTSSLKILKVYPPRHYRHEGLTDKIECFNCSAMKPESSISDPSSVTDVMTQIMS
jgi:hypothetical protein